MSSAAAASACAVHHAPATQAVKPDIYLILTGLLMATGTFVVREPAPFDLGIMLLGLIGLVCGRLAFSRLHRYLIVLLAGYLVVNIICLQFAADAEVARGYLLITAYLVLSCVFFVGVLSHYGLRGWAVLLGGYALSGVVSSLASTLTYWGLLPLRDEVLLFGRPKGWFKDPNVFGPYLVVIVVWGVVRLQRQAASPFRTMLWTTGLLAALMGVGWAFSRACWINCAVSLGAYFAIACVKALRTGRVRRRPMYVLLFTSLALVGAGVILGFTGQRMLQMRLGQSGLQNYDSMRFYTQRRALAIVGHQPLGMGPGQSEEVLGYSTHSMYLRILAENGVPGFLIFYSLVGVGLARALRLALSQEDSETTDLFAFVSACLIGTLINGLVIDTIHWRHFWLLIAMAWCSSPAQERSYCPVSFSTTAPPRSRLRISTV